MIITHSSIQLQCNSMTDCDVIYPSCNHIDGISLLEIRNKKNNYFATVLLRRSFKSQRI